MKRMVDYFRDTQVNKPQVDEEKRHKEAQEMLIIIATMLSAFALMLLVALVQ